MDGGSNFVCAVCVGGKGGILPICLFGRSSTRWVCQNAAMPANHCQKTDMNIVATWLHTQLCLGDWCCPGRRHEGTSRPGTLLSIRDEKPLEAARMMESSTSVCIEAGALVYSLYHVPSGYPFKSMVSMSEKRCQQPSRAESNHRKQLAMVAEDDQPSLIDDGSTCAASSVYGSDQEKDHYQPPTSTPSRPATQNARHSRQAEPEELQHQGIRKDSLDPEKTESWRPTTPEDEGNHLHGAKLALVVLALCMSVFVMALGESPLSLGRRGGIDQTAKLLIG